MKKTDPRCSDCSQRQNGLFCNLAPGTLKVLDEVKNVEHYRAGQVVFHEGQKPRALFCVYSGRLMVFKVGRNDEEQVINLLGPASLTGYRSILAGESYTATAEAIEASTLCAFPPQMLFDLVRKSEDFSLQLLTRLARDIRVSQEYMIIRAQESVRHRTARVLVWLMEVDGADSDKPPEPVVRLKRAEIARIVATTPETLSRTLSGLAERGYIRLTRTEIAATNLPALRKLALGSGVPPDLSGRTSHGK